MAAASTSMAATAVFASRFPLSSTTKAAPARCSALPYLPPRLSATAFPSSLKFAGTPLCPFISFLCFLVTYNVSLVVLLPSINVVDGDYLFNVHVIRKGCVCMLGGGENPVQ